MAALVTLATTTLNAFINDGDQVINVASAVGMTPGTRLFCDGELMAVIGPGVLSNLVVVRRGVDGTRQMRHDPFNNPIYIGRGDQFYSFDPLGHPLEAVLVVPHINVLNGNIWFPVGDEIPIGKTDRYWALQTESNTFGPLGVRQNVLNPTGSV